MFFVPKMLFFIRFSLWVGFYHWGKWQKGLLVLHAALEDRVEADEGVRVEGLLGGDPEPHFDLSPSRPFRNFQASVTSG